MTGFVILGLFLFLAILKVPIAVSMAIPSILYIIANDIPLSIVAHRMTNSINSLPLLAVPLFIFAANLMNTSGMTRNIFDFAKLLIGKVRGGLALVNVLASLIFAGISGAALADVGGLGSIEMQAMNEQGYDPDVSASITAASATIGPIFPPSIPLIVYATVAETSGVKCLIAGIIPGIILTIILMLQVTYFAQKYNYPRETKTYTLKERLKTFLQAFPAILAPLIMIGGLLTGFLSPTEIGAFATFYAIIIGRFIYKELSWEQFIKMARQSMYSTATIMIIIASAAIFAWVLTVEQIPLLLTKLLLGFSKSPVVLLLMTNVILLIVGMFLESNAAILVFTPLLAPPLLAVGVDPVHLGLVMVFNLMIGLLTPPVGMSLYMVSVVANRPMEKVLKALIPYYIPLLLTLLLITFVPGLSLWLPSLISR